MKSGTKSKASMRHLVRLVRPTRNGEAPKTTQKEQKAGIFYPWEVPPDEQLQDNPFVIGKLLGQLRIVVGGYTFRIRLEQCKNTKVKS